MPTKKSKASSSLATPIEALPTPEPSAKAVQAISEAPPPAEPKLPITLRTDVGFEYHLDLAKSVVAGILDPDVPDVFIEVPSPIRGMRRFLHTAFIKEVDVRGLE